MRILFVDNHPEFTATVVESFLRAHEVVIVPTIAAAKECLQTSTFDVVLVDYDLDDGKGDELARSLRVADATAKIVAVSARASGNEALLAAGANRVCKKTDFAGIEAVLQDLVTTPSASLRPRIYADFNGLMASPRETSKDMVPLDTWGSLRDLSNAGVKLREGTKLVIHDASDDVEDLEGDAVAFYDPAREWWYAELERGFSYVPARDRSRVMSFLCLGCRRDLGPEALVTDTAIVKRYDDCPHCGFSILSAIEPPLR